MERRELMGEISFLGKKIIICEGKKPHKAGATTFSLINDIPIHK